ncbi:MAG: ExbD/TolR family protein, partial [Pseudanabaena sp.]
MANQPLEIKNLLPLMDVIFALLTFFVLSSLFLNRTEGLPVDLPKA